jgi:hypothetical protein
MFNFVNTYVRETSPQSIGTVTAAGFVPVANGPGGTQYSGLPLVSSTFASRVTIATSTTSTSTTRPR